LRSREENPVAKQLVQQGMGCLDARQRIVVELYYWQGLTTAEIGKEIGLKEGHVQVTLHRARQKMKARLTMQAA
jgi:RNA polymerase sigma factor (sigma-70 family)